MTLEKEHSVEGQVLSLISDLLDALDEAEEAAPSGRDRH